MPPRKQAQILEWQRFKPVIQQMILQKNKSLQETRQWLEDHGLPVTSDSLLLLLTATNAAQESTARVQN